MTKSKTHEQTQADKFRDLARELECDEDEEAFKAAVRKVGTAPRESKKDEQKD